MSFFDFFSKRKQPEKDEAPAHWMKCSNCGAIIYYKEMEKNNFVCHKCDYHLRISAQKRVKLLFDENSFTEYDQNLVPTDPLAFVDKKSYKKRIEEAYKKTGLNSSTIAGEGCINGVIIQTVIFDFAFMGGSLGSVEGEKIVRAVKRCIERKQPLVIFSASGGARMQESTFSLMQMSKTSAALAMLRKMNLPYISVLTDPCMGGVSASFATLGDIILAEPKALIGFAGQRVIKQTIGADLPKGFQKAEFLLEKGQIDMVVDRRQLKQTVADLAGFLSK